MTDPFIESNFGIELTTYSGQSLGFFSAITGGSMSIVVVEYTHLLDEGGSMGIYIPSATSFEPIILSFGLTDDMEFWSWWTNMANGYRHRIDASIFAVGSNSQRLAQWNLEDVWPSRISGFNFHSDSNKYFLASVTLVAENIVRVSPP